MEDTRQCIPLLWICNGQADCPLGSDEENCCESYNMKDCTTPKILSFCAPESLLCTENTCLQYENETCGERSIGEGNCANHAFLCSENGMCLSQSEVCDGTPQCQSKQDELLCQGKINQKENSDFPMKFDSLSVSMNSTFIFPSKSFSLQMEII